MKTSKRTLCLLLALSISGCLAVRLEVQLRHSLEEASYHSRLSASADPLSNGDLQPGIRSGLVLAQDIHVCHSCLTCSPRVSVAFEPAKDWNARLMTGSPLAAFQRLPFFTSQVDCPNRRAPPSSLLS